MTNGNDREIERKYLLRALPARVVGARALEIDQGYLPGERINERIRRARGADGVRYYRTIKAGSGLERLEVEEETTELFFTTVWPLTRGSRVRKRRYVIEDAGVTWEVDEFLDRDGLWLAEVELEHAEHVATPPEWLRAVIEREVTYDPSYTNHALAR
jgi:adenylate cyclase